MKFKKRELLYNILSVIACLGFNTGELIDAMTSGYAQSYKKLRRLRPKSSEEFYFKIKDFFEKSSEDPPPKQSIYNVIHYLKKDGLIEDNNDRWQITEKGGDKQIELEKWINKVEAWRCDYKRQPGNAIVIVSFDIPETEKIKREWLRSALKNLGLRMLQKSVWIGKVKIPKEFLEDAQRINLLDYVEIFSVTRSGTLRYLA